MKRSLNLDSMFIPSPLPEIELSIAQFGGGEWNIKLNNNIDYNKIDEVLITNRILNGDDIFKILLAVDALRIKGVKNISLFIPYLPYARQDRLCNEGESFSLKVFCNLINSLNLNKVYVLDAHSDVGPALLNNCTNLSSLNSIDLVWKRLGRPILISPDAGANKKMNKISESLDSKLTKCDKSRDLATGKLTKFEVFGEFNGEDVLIVDDICSYGGTFKGLAKELKAKGAGKVNLFVTHFEGVVSEIEGIDEIFTTNSINHQMKNTINITI